MTVYPTLRTVHLLCGVFALPGLLMYGISAIQMAHTKWFNMKPTVTETRLDMRSGYTDGRVLAREAMRLHQIRGQINSVKQTPTGFDIRVIVPGTVHEVQYDSSSGTTTLRTNVAGVMGMLNRLHHAAGLYHEYVPLKAWGVLVALISLATVGLGMTGLWMWWLRRQERKLGLILLGANLVFSVVVLVMLRAAGP